MSGDHTAQVRKLLKWGKASSTRAHVGLAHAEGLSLAGGNALKLVAQAIEAQLGRPVAAECRLLPGVADLRTAFPKDAAFAQIEVGADRALALLEIDLPALLYLLDLFAGGKGTWAPARGLTRIEEACFGFLALVAIRALGGQEIVRLHFRPHLRSVGAGRDEALRGVDVDERYLSIELRWTLMEQDLAFRLNLPARFLAGVAAELRSKPRIDASSPILQAAALAILHFGKASLDPADVRALKPGDVVVFEGATLQGTRPKGTARVRTAAFTLEGELTVDGFLVNATRTHASPEEVMIAIVNDSNPEDLAAGLPIEVEIELARMRLPLSDLTAITKGSVLMLPVDFQTPVLLKVGDRVVARAELVEIEGAVGARILGLVPGSSSTDEGRLR